MIAKHAFGRTPLTVSRLGLGTGRLDTLPDADALRLLDEAYALGIRVLDTAPSYGRAESLIGRWVKATRPQLVLSTKVGYGVPGVEDWTGAAVGRGIERALRTLNVPHLDVVHLHSCPGHVALRDDIQRAIEDALVTGKIAVAAYSGENEDLDAALASPLFTAVQLSVSIVDQGSRELRLADLARRGLGVLAKRPLAGGPWSTAEAAEPGEQEYRRRFERLALPEPPGGWGAFALRFSAYSPGVAAVLVGTCSIERLRALAEALARGPLDAEEEARIVDRWRGLAHGWRGIV